MGEFGKLWGAGTISSLGDGMSGVAGPLLAAALTRDPVQVAGLMVAERAPWVLLTLPGGALVDRTDRRRVMTAAGLVRVAGLGGLALAVAWGRPSLWLLYAAFAVIGTAGVLYDNAATAVLPSVIGRDGLERANGRLLATRTIGDSLAGPPLGGWLFAAVAWLPFLVDAVAFVLVTALTLTLSRSAGAIPAPPCGTLRDSIRGGLSWLLRHRLLRTVSVMVAVSNVSLGAAGSVLVLYAQQRLGLGPVGYGLLLVSIAVGGVLGGLAAGRVVAAIGAGTALRIGMVIEVAHNLGLALTRNVVLAGVALALLGLHLVVTSTILASLRQSIAPPSLLGRVHSSYKLLSASGMLLGATVGGLIAATFGLTAPFWLGVVGMSAITMWTWRHVSNQRVRDAQPSARSSAT